jgi:ketosteroid isomerase-like protein
MRNENVEIVRRVCEAAWVRPRPDYETLNELVHPNAEMRTVQSMVEGGSYQGPKGFQDWLKSFNETFGEDWECHLVNAEAIDGERVLGEGLISVESVRGGVPLEQQFWVMCAVREGKVARSDIYLDRDEAQRAAGLGG